MPELIAPTARLHAAWLEAHAEWGPGQHEDGFGLRPSDEVDSPAGFEAWLARLASQSDPVQAIDPAAHRCTYRWIVEDDRVLGGMALRYGSDDYVRWAGHIGYGIRPSARRRGLASWALDRMLGDARALGLDRALVVCAVDNLASVKTIERCGGVFEAIRDTKFGPVRRYWIVSKAGQGSIRRAAMLLIVTEDGGLLLHHRDDKGEIPNPDCWAGFGGAVEDGETVEDAVLREALEETGLQIADPVFLTEAVDDEGDGRTVSLFYIVGGVRPEDIDLHEGAGVAVHKIEDLPGLKITPFVRRAIYSHLLPVIATVSGYGR
jgi:predicted acetyltransferase/8-oxo-dGTP pyrophosphatase MutT (NUDIX family)